ncbi:MAG: helix-turn-helix domain-containing protein [Defluviitaleaceae bacterium]|nr:helix-turn-helix domain-containing protein [Defluviitaleaceae bacterium]
MERELLTLGEAAKLIKGLTQYRLRILCEDGEIKHYRFGRKYMISNVELLSYFGFTSEEKYDIMKDGNTLGDKGA